jgi:hypothetical protein
MSININLQEAAIQAELILLNRQPRIVEAFNVLADTQDALAAASAMSSEFVGDLAEYDKMVAALDNVNDLFPTTIGGFRYSDGVPGAEHVTCEYTNDANKHMYLAAGSTGFEIVNV